ncbi:S1 family peptidase [Subtercola boreus]|nr:S1 family peptidase [Subtercola boreus]
MMTGALVLLVALSLPQTAQAGSTEVDLGAPSADIPRLPEIQPASAPTTRTPSDDPAYGTWQNDFLAAADVIRQGHPDELAEVVVGDDLNSGTVGFAAAAPAEALEQLGKLGRVRVTENLGYTEKSVSDTAAQVYSLAKATLGPEAELNTYYDGADGNFHVKYSSSAPADDAYLRSSISAQLVLPGNKRLVVESDPSDMLEMQNLQGGHVTYWSGILMCTSAFPVKKRDGADIGVLTAGHCPGATTQWVPGGGMYFSVQPNSQSTSSSYPGGDFRWLRSSEMFDGLTWTGTDYRRFAGAGIAALNSNICKYGATTGYGCSRVAQLFVGSQSRVLPEDGGGLYDVYPLTCSATNITAGGDSGGPWYSQNVAYGVHTAGGASRSCWSSAALALSRFNLVLWTGP